MPWTQTARTSLQRSPTPDDDNITAPNDGCPPDSLTKTSPPRDGVKRYAVPCHEEEEEKQTYLSFNNDGRAKQHHNTARRPRLKRPRISGACTHKRSANTSDTNKAESVAQVSFVRLFREKRFPIFIYSSRHLIYSGWKIHLMQTTVLTSSFALKAEQRDGVFFFVFFIEVALRSPLSQPRGNANLFH